MNKLDHILFRFFPVVIMLGISSIFAFSQEELKVEDVKVIKEFEARLKDFNKILLTPQLPSFDIGSRSFEYKVSSKPLKLKYEKPSIRPLAMPKEELRKNTDAFLKLGYGLPNAALGEFSIGKYQDNFSSAVAVHHLSANNKSIRDQKFLTNGIDFTISDAFVNDLSYNGHAFVNVDYYNLYGVVAGADTVTQYSSPQRRFMHWDAGADISKKEITSKMDGAFGFKHRFIHNNIENIYENNFFGSANIDYSITDGMMIRLPLALDYSGSNSGADNILLFSFMPYLSYRSTYYSLKLGADMAYSDRYLIYPSGRISLHKVFSYFDFFAGADNKFNINNTYDKALENPFLHLASDSIVTSNSSAYYIGVRGDIEGAKFEFSSSYSIFKNLHLFVPSAMDKRQFSAIYGSGSDILLKGQIDYEITKQISLSGQITKHFYSMDSIAKAWHRPDFEADFTTRISLLDNKLKVMGALFFASGLYYPDVTNNDAVKLPVIFDISGQVEYELWRDFNLFVKWNNITAKKYNRWYQYPSYRIHLIGGVKVLF